MENSLISKSNLHSMNSQRQQEVLFDLTFDMTQITNSEIPNLALILNGISLNPLAQHLCFEFLSSNDERVEVSNIDI